MNELTNLILGCIPVIVYYFIIVDKFYSKKVSKAKIIVFKRGTNNAMSTINNELNNKKVS